MQSAFGNQAVLRRIERIPVGRVDDPAEREADRMAARVLRMATPDLPSPSRIAPMVQRMCDRCEEEPRLQRKESTGDAPGEAPTVVHEVLASPGSPLGDDVRAFFEPRFDAQLSHVRVHTGARASESASAVGAVAYTVGNHVVLGEGQSGRRDVIAHELAHVLQQTGGRPVLRRLRACRHLIDAEERTVVPEFQVRDAVANQARSLGTVEKELFVPGGSAAPYRTDSRHRPNTIEPQVIGPAIPGKIDIAVLTGTTLDIIEVKRASWAPDGVLFGEVQLANYLVRAAENIDEVQRLWRERNHPGDRVTMVRPMRSTRLIPQSPQQIGGNSVSLAWCHDGLLSFKAVGDQDQDTLVCGADDRGAIDAFLDRAMHPAQDTADRFVTRELDTRLARAMEGVSLRDTVQRFLRSPQGQQYLPSVGQDAIIESLLRTVGDAESEVRALVLAFMHAVIAEVRRRLQAELRAMLQQAMTTVCATATVVTMRQLLSALERQMRARALSLIPQVASDLIQAYALTIAGYFLVAVVAIIAAYLLWEIAAAIAAIEGVGAALGTAAAWVLRLLTGGAPIGAGLRQLVGNH